ncbi:MAG: hypothetical protein ACREKL_16825 [Chthoniobacterales bacterium]
MRHAIPLAFLLVLVAHARAETFVGKIRSEYGRVFIVLKMQNGKPTSLALDYSRVVIRGYPSDPFGTDNVEYNGMTGRSYTSDYLVAETQAPHMRISHFHFGGNSILTAAFQSTSIVTNENYYGIVTYFAPDSGDPTVVMETTPPSRTVKQAIEAGSMIGTWKKDPDGRIVFTMNLTPSGGGIYQISIELQPRKTGNLRIHITSVRIMPYHDTPLWTPIHQEGRLHPVN